jgi:hypothetical protein
MYGLITVDLQYGVKVPTARRVQYGVRSSKTMASMQRSLGPKAMSAIVVEAGYPNRSIEDPGKGSAFRFLP